MLLIELQYPELPRVVEVQENPCSCAKILQQVLPIEPHLVRER